MSNALLSLAQEYLQGRLSPAAFARQFIDAWKHERDCGLLIQDDPVLSELLSDIFCLADNFNPNEDREIYEFDDEKFFNLVYGRVNESR